MARGVGRVVNAVAVAETAREAPGFVGGVGGGSGGVGGEGSGWMRSASGGGVLLCEGSIVVG